MNRNKVYLKNQMNAVRFLYLMESVIHLVVACRVCMFYDMSSSLQKCLLKLYFNFQTDRTVTHSKTQTQHESEYMINNDAFFAILENVQKKVSINSKNRIYLHCFSDAVV